MPEPVFALLREKYLAEVTPYKNFVNSVKRKALSFGGDAVQPVIKSGTWLKIKNPKSPAATRVLEGGW